MGYRAYQAQLHTITPTTRRRSIVVDPPSRWWLGVLALGCLAGALVMLAVLVAG